MSRERINLAYLKGLGYGAPRDLICSLEKTCAGAIWGFDNESLAAEGSTRRGIIDATTQIDGSLTRLCCL